MRRWKVIVFGVILALGVGASSCGGGSCLTMITSCTPNPVKAGQSVEIFGTDLGGAAKPTVTFSGPSGTSTATPNFGDDQSIDVTVPATASGTVTIKICTASCTVTVTPAN
jgi:hypothetical protein